MKTNDGQDSLRIIFRNDFVAFVDAFFWWHERRVFKWSRHHFDVVNALMNIHAGRTTYQIINIPPRYSKAIDCETFMWTPDGWKTAGQIKIGDRLLGSNGKWTKVIGVHPQGTKPAYNVTFSDGASIIACADHRWSARLRDKSKDGKWSAPWHIKTTAEIADDLLEADKRKKWRIPVLNDTNEVDVDLPIDPYLLGCWLGDGNTHMAAITTMDQSIIDCFSEYDPKPYKHQSAGKATTYGLRNGFVTKLKSIGVLKNKHIPVAYMLGSHKQRIALLQGICDTDGWVGTTNGQQGVSSSNKRLSDDIRALLCSLGAVCRGFQEQPKKGKTSYKTFFSMADGDVAFRLDRKKEKINKRSAHNMPRRFFSSIEPVEPREMVCFTVDAKDKLFCAGRDFIVTHNTELVVKMFTAWAYAFNPECKFLHLSYSDDLVSDNSNNIRDIMQLEEYEALFPLSAINRKVSATQRWHTVSGGEFLARPAGGSVTGFGAGAMDETVSADDEKRYSWMKKGGFKFSGCILIDDPLKPEDAYSDTMRQSVNRRWDSTIKSRRNNAKTTPVVCIMQRLHEDDFTAKLLKSKEFKFEHLSLSALVEVRKGSYIALWPEKHSVEALISMREEDIYTFSAQYQQAPAPQGGGIFKREWFRFWDFLPISFERVVAFADTAGETKKENDYTVFQLWGLKECKIYLIDQIRGKWESPDMLRISTETLNRWKSEFPSLQCLKIEKAAVAIGFIQTLKRQLQIPILPMPRQRDKTSRAFSAAPYIQSGMVLLPPERIAFHSELVQEVQAFTANDTHAHDDQVDPMMDAVEEFFINPKVSGSIMLGGGR